MLKFLLLLLGAGVSNLVCQETELRLLTDEAARIRVLTAEPNGPMLTNIGKFIRPDWARFQNLLRDWIETQLPKDLSSLNASFQGLEARLSEDLQRAGLSIQRQHSSEAGYTATLKFSRPADAPDLLLVESGVIVPCGENDAIYLYRFTDSGRARLLEADGSRQWGDHLSASKFSPPDAAGSRLLYLAWQGVSCASVWNGLDYRLFRVGPYAEPAQPILADHETNTIDSAVKVELTANELLLELSGHALFPGDRRTHLLRYQASPDGVRRTDPVALSPEHFVHEWMSRPWSEMQSRSSPSLERWHKFLHADYVSGEPGPAQQCKERAKTTQIGVGMLHLGGRETPEPLGVYFLVEDGGDRRFKMVAVSFDSDPGCSDGH